MGEFEKMRHDARVFGTGIMRDGVHVPIGEFFIDPIGDAAKKLGATRADVPGLWNVPGHPELTTNQLLALAGQ